MPVIKGDKSNAEPNDGPKTKERSHSGRSEESGGAEEEEEEDSESDIDQEEIERGLRRRRECVAAMNFLEKQFMSWKEEVFTARFRRIEERLAGLKTGESQEYKAKVQELREKQYAKDLISWSFNERNLKCAQVMHEARKIQSRQTFENGKWMVKQKLRDDIERRLKELEEEHNNIQVIRRLTEELDLDPEPETDEASGFGEPSEPRKKPVAVTGPCVIHNLDEKTLYADLAFFGKLANAARVRYQFL